MVVSVMMGCLIMKYEGLLQLFRFIAWMTEYQGEIIEEFLKLDNSLEEFREMKWREYYGPQE